MSYNVSTWKTKELDNFQIPLEAIHSNSDLEIEVGVDEISVFGWTESFEINGKLVDGSIVVSDLHYSGAGSGSSWGDFKLMLAQTRGFLASSQVWENGSISRLKVTDGAITEEQIEI
ncbi:MAG: hypothetical protein GY797_34200 [Deltaproteobacteria bacterium]|nr:hypothetical protein [Deltaproteobacteria bacterium]